MSDFDQSLDDDLEALRQQGLYRVRRRLQSAQGVHVRLGGRTLLNFASNDYLNLASDPRLARAAARAARRFGCGAGASALVSGLLLPLRALERALALWEQTEAALVFSSGFAANLAVISSLAGAEDAIFSDALNHASLIDGCRLSRARSHIYQHGDVQHLEQLLQAEGNKARRRFIITDTVFSMDGDLAPLAALVDLATRYDCLLVLDEAHATGVFGEEGRGLTELVPEISRLGSRLIKIGTLSKALGTQGGFVCGSRALIDWLINRARPYVFSTALAPPTAAAARRAVTIARSASEPRRHLHGLADWLRCALINLGYPKSRSESPIVPLIVGESHTALELSARLQEQGFLVPAIRPPSVPEGTARLRISLSAGHSQEDVQRLVQALGSAKSS